ncbi:hypothetical protein CHS0354_002794 [Potamilus streckersoni]|uniref:Myotubularin phosphatase domain-containing protein n=1 Tax=Potamilus streckersoni TaxID=2493646 RepID=A0AAE0SP32_9BIVA|nr:hypothetical protein CHS0354_002794 [Potamilus streckersoni]
MHKRMSGFISYLTQSSLERRNSDQVEESASEFFDMELNPHLLPGERVVGEIDNVLKFTPFTEGKQGISGKLFVTNFKIAFVTADRSSYVESNYRQRNQLVIDEEVPLTSILAIYHEASNGKRKKLTRGMTLSSHTKTLEVHCKDFRIHTYSFRFSQKVQNKQFPNILNHYANPSQESHLFAYEYGRNLLKGSLPDSPTPLFDSIGDWEQEISRQDIGKFWRVTDVNMGFNFCLSLPQYFVVPHGLVNSDLMKASHQFIERRVPTWSYTHTNGNSLVRMASLDPNTAHREYEKRMLDAVKVAGMQRNSPKVVDMSECCPSLKDVQESFSKMCKLCMTDNAKDFLMQDMNWYSSLEDTKWLQLVAQCMRTSNEVAELIQSKQRSVVIKESNGRNFSCVVSSMVQIMLDPYFRTIDGFQSMIQREWVKMGHPFQTNHCLLGSSDTDQMQPVFLLFLDCVWQLLQQFPGCFAFTDTYLTTLWDTVHIGLFETFLFDSDYQRSKFSSQEGKNIRKVRLPCTWSWRMQFSDENMSFFRDPLYLLTHDPQLSEALKETKLLANPGKYSQLLRSNKSYSKKLENILDENKSWSDSFNLETLIPITLAPVIRFWTQCFLRWQAPAQIISGGTPSQYLQQCHMVEEILHLHHKAQVLQHETRVNSTRPKSELIFSPAAMGTPQVSEILNSVYLTSSFPFSPGPTTQQQIMSFTPTISIYLQNSSVEYDLADEED